MNLHEFQSAAMRFSPDDHDRIHYACMGLMGECGEVIDVIKKQKFRFHRRAGVEEMTEELGDVMWYLAELATGLNIDLNAELRRKNFQTTDYRNASTEKYAVTMLNLALKCYTHGCIEGKRSAAMTCMRKIFACVKMIAQDEGIGMREILEGNIEKLKRRYPHGCG